GPIIKGTAQNKLCRHAQISSLLISFPAVILVTPAFPGSIVLIAAGSLVGFFEMLPLLLNLPVPYFLLLCGLPAKEQKEQQSPQNGDQKQDMDKANKVCRVK